MRTFWVLLLVFLAGMFHADARGETWSDADSKDLALKSISQETGGGAVPQEKKEEKEKEEGAFEKLGLEFYGHFKLDMSHDSARTNFGDTAFFVKNYAPGESDDQINITARHSRLGLNWYGPEMGPIKKAFGKIEIDFLGKGLQLNTETSELQPALRMRHAYMKFDFANGWSFIAGQTWDLFAPINMPKLNTLVGWGQGNIGFRRPQLSIFKKIGLGQGSDLTAAIGVARPVSRDKDGLGNDDGQDSGVPDLQGHVGFKVPAWTEKAMSLGFGGFWGRREVDENGTTISHQQTYSAYCYAFDLTIPVVDKLTFISEIWQGQGLDGYRGAVWQSYVPVNGDVKVVEAWGTFGNLIWKPMKKWRFVAGAGIDNPKNGSLHHNTKARYKNSSIFGNALYTFYKGATVGIEYERMSTDYLNYQDRVNHRVQVSFMLKF